MNKKKFIYFLKQTYTIAIIPQFEIGILNNFLICKASCFQQCDAINKNIYWFNNNGSILEPGFLNNTYDSEQNILYSPLSEDFINSSLNTNV